MSKIGTHERQFGARVAEAVSLSRRQALALVVLTCIPVPLLTLGGIVVPFPDLVQRALAQLLPFVDSPGSAVTAPSVRVSSLQIRSAPSDGPAGIERPSSAASPTVLSRTARPASVTSKPAPESVPESGGGDDGGSNGPSGPVEEPATPVPPAGDGGGPGGAGDAGDGSGGGDDGTNGGPPAPEPLPPEPEPDPPIHDPVPEPPELPPEHDVLPPLPPLDPLPPVPPPPPGLLEPPDGVPVLPDPPGVPGLHVKTPHLDSGNFDDDEDGHG